MTRGSHPIRDTEPILRLKICGSPDCRAVFTVCVGCDRGQRYCSGVCRDRVRRQRRREADQRYQQSERGREAHRCRQQRYRERRVSASVTDQGCRTVAETPTLVRSPLCQCRICGRSSRWINPFPSIPRRRRSPISPRSLGPPFKFVRF
jgi:hypothetical protein